MLKNNCFRIRELRVKVGLTQAQLALQLNLRSASTVTMWERGVRHPTSAMLPRLAQELQCTIPELYSGKASVS